MTPGPLITNDAVVLGLLAVLLGAVFYTASSAHPFWRRGSGFVQDGTSCSLAAERAACVELVSR